MNIVMIIVGLIICFGGIYIRKVCSAFLGFIWGALASFLVALIIGGLWSIDDGTVTTMIIVGLVLAVVCAIFDRACTAITSFLSSFTVAALLLLILRVVDSETALFAVAAIVAIIISGISIKFYDYSYMLITAITGAFIASVGFFSLTKGYDFEDILMEIVWNGFDEMSGVLIGTIILSIIGFIVQRHRFVVGKNENSHATGSPSTVSTGTPDVSNLFNSEQINNVKDTVSVQAQRVKNTASPVIKDAGDVVKDVWSDMGTESGRQSIKEDFIKEKYLLIAPAISFVVIPLLYRLISTDLSYRIISWISLIATAITLGAVVCFTLLRTPKFRVVFCAVYSLTSLIFNFQMIRYGVWYDLVHLLWYEIICFSLHYISKALTGKSSRPIVLAICAVALNYFILQWLSTFSIWFYFSIRHIVAIALVFGTVYFVCKKRLNINVFKLNGNSVKQSGSTISEEKEALKRCPSCGAATNAGDLFCQSCGTKL